MLLQIVNFKKKLCAHCTYFDILYLVPIYFKHKNNSNIDLRKSDLKSIIKFFPTTINLQLHCNKT